MRSQALQVAGQIASSKLTSLKRLKGAAHMTPTPEHIEAVARAIAFAEGYSTPDDEIIGAFEDSAITAIAAARPFIRTQALEEAAKMCEECPLYDEDGVDWNTDPQVTLAAAIRALKERS